MKASGRRKVRQLNDEVLDRLFYQDLVRILSEESGGYRRKEVNPPQIRYIMDGKRFGHEGFDVWVYMTREKPRRVEK